MSPISATNTAGSTGPTPGICASTVLSSSTLAPLALVLTPKAGADGSSTATPGMTAGNAGPRWPYPPRVLNMIPRPTFGPLAGRRSRALARRAAPAALALLGGARTDGWHLGEPFYGRGDTGVFAVRGEAGSPALLKATGTRQGRLQLERQVEVLAALHADHRLGPWARLVPRTLGVGDVDGLHFVLESRLAGVDPRWASAADRARLTPLALEVIAELQARTGTVAPVDEAAVDRWVRQAAAHVRNVVRAEHRLALDRLEAELVAVLAGRNVARSWTHGDFNRTNVLLDGGRISGIVDWCEAEPDGLVGADAVTLLISERMLDGAELGQVLLRWLDEPGPVAEIVTKMQRDRGGEQLDIRTMLLLSWLRHVAANLADSTRYAANPVWMHRNVRAVLQGISSAT
jgi:aminoglycoside phosphotransferase